jgi:hypothetical protein
MSDREREPIVPVTKSHTTRESTDRVRGEQMANQVAGVSGTRLVAPVRESMEAQFGADFSNVHVHHDRAAGEAARALGARAFTIGSHIAFNEGEYAPTTLDGRRLLAHELTHVEQQRAAAAGRASISRDPDAERDARVTADRVTRGYRVASGWKSYTGAVRIQPDDQKTDVKQAPAAQPSGVRVNFVLRAPDDAYTRDVVDYVTNTLKETVVEVDNIDEAATYLSNYAKTNKVKVSQVRLIGHGSTAGGIKMTPKGETGRRFVTPQELEQMAADEKLKTRAQEGMAPDATVEFYGCYIGRSEQSTKAVGQIFGSDVKAVEDTLRTKQEMFTRPADHGEKGDEIPGRKGKWMTVVSTDEIDFRVQKGDKKLGQSFDAWLVAQAKVLEAGGDLPPQPDDRTRIATMRDVFNRSGGKIKRLEISHGGQSVERGDKKKWLDRWKVTKK